LFQSRTALTVTPRRDNRKLTGRLGLDIEKEIERDRGGVESGTEVC